MSKTLLDIIDELVDAHGTEGAIDRIMVNDWPLDTKDRAISMLERRNRSSAMVEGGEIGSSEFFQ